MGWEDYKRNGNKSGLILSEGRKIVVILLKSSDSARISQTPGWLEWLATQESATVLAAV